MSAENYEEKHIKGLADAYRFMLKIGMKMSDNTVQLTTACPLGDVPYVCSNKGPRQVVFMSGIDLWLNGSLKHPDVSEEEAFKWLDSQESKYM